MTFDRNAQKRNPVGLVADRQRAWQIIFLASSAVYVVGSLLVGLVSLPFTGEDSLLYISRVFRSIFDNKYFVAPLLLVFSVKETVRLGSGPTV